MMKEYSDAEIANMSIRQINKIFRKDDDSHPWPICGRFNATERAIRKIRRERREGLEINAGLEYWLALEREISTIVNNV